MPTLTYSPSKLTSYATCPRQYHFKYVRKLPGRLHANQSFGSSLHRALQAIYQAGGPSGRSPDQLAETLSASWSALGYQSPEHARSELARGQELLARYQERWSDETSIPVLLEKRMSAPYREVVFLGIVDRVDRDSDGALHVIDYKSGRAPESGRIPEHTARQLALYHHLVRAKLGEAPGRHSVHYLASDVRLSIETDETALSALLDEAHGLACAIREAVAFEPTPGSHCLHCDFQARCKEGSRMGDRWV